MVLEAIIAWAQQFVAQFSYLGVFLLSIASTSTIFFPLPLYAVEFLIAGLGLNPLLLGISAGIGSGIGELTGYFVGVGGRQVLGPKIHRELKKWMAFKELFKKYGFFVIILTALLPFPFDIIGILSGVGNYDIKKFLLATIIGKTIKTTAIAYAGFIAIPYAEIFLRELF